MSGATVTPAGVRDGDPAALAGLCAVRGPSVVAYCRHVAGEANAGAAAADAFAHFRVAVVAAGDTSSLDPEALLVAATRTSAAAHASTSGQDGCADVPTLLAQRAEKTITPADLERLESHLERCWACRAPVARLKAAERAYRDPPEKTVDDMLTAQIVGALIAAVPSAPPPRPTPASPNGSAAEAPEAEAEAPEAEAEAPEAEAEAPEAEAAPPPPSDQPTEDVAMPRMAEPPPEETGAGDEAAAGARRRRRSERKPADADAGAGALLSRLRSPGRARGPRSEQPSSASKRPRQPRAFGPPIPGAERKRSALRLTVVLPIVLVLLALLAALYVSGVFGSDDPATTPSVSVPTARPAEPVIVPVPDAKDATADAVETAKARARGDDAPTPAAKRREKAESERPPAPASPPPVDAGPRPAAPAASANNPVTPPPPPAPRRNAGAGDEKQIDAGSGATGAEQIPPAEDPSDVPDLAPPEPTTP